MTTKKTTIHDIARELNTTASTVSRALKNHPSISVQMKERVKSTAERLSYRQNKIASSLRSGRSHIIGVIIPSADVSFFGSVVHGIERVARSNGYNVLLFQSNESTAYELEGVEALLQSRVDGILASPAKETADYGHFIEIKKRNVPLILFDRADDNLSVPSVVIDDYRGAFMATEHLIQQGYKRIAHISGQQHIKIFTERLRGYTDALKHYSLDIDDNLIASGKVSIESGKECTMELLNKENPPDAIFAVEDFTAFGAIQALKESGIRIPDEMGVIGFANESFSQYISPPLSTIDQQTAKMGEEAAKLFLNQVTEKVKPAFQKIVLEPRLIVRESSLRKNMHI
ncbi:LacI family DNA-binding transcriptional regulator [Rubrolithibacter danxiaensis]|uniref:LacI family DNA-binding transcriptional regulator n=1 Tax=Rubrolithibacter danxiaensis TaxID=3390805 RepID=UPI003BF928CF